MSDELELDLDVEEINRKDSRIKSLSDKVKTTAEERDALRAEAERVKAEKEAIAKEAEFYKGFNQVSSKYQGANEYQDKIWEKVKSGYDLEDATVAILAKEGKFSPQAQPEVKQPPVAGGSASTGLKLEDKSPSEMSQDERRAILEKEFHF